MPTSLRKPIIRTIVLLVVLAIIFVIIANGSEGSTIATWNLFSIVIILALIALVWFRHFRGCSLDSKETAPLQDKPVQVVASSQDRSQGDTGNGEKPETGSAGVTVPSPLHRNGSPEEAVVETVTTRTGQTCTMSGEYVCKEHPERTVQMVEGKRFPPCRGNGSGHSAIWVLPGTLDPSVDDPLATKTGQVCARSGQYMCSMHSEHTVRMEVGKRFPPCRGDGKGHSARWVKME